jgi:hypothetical protein
MIYSHNISSAEEFSPVVVTYQATMAYVDTGRNLANTMRTNRSFSGSTLSTTALNAGTLATQSISSNVTRTPTKLDDTSIYTDADITLPSYTDLKLSIGDVLVVSVINTGSSAITVTSPTNTSSVPAQSTKVISLYAYTTALYRAL